METIKVHQLTHSEVHKRIISKPVVIRHYEDLRGPFSKYNNELHTIYDEKKKQFLDACKQYNKLNQETMYVGGRRLHDYYINRINYDFLEEFNPQDCECIDFPECEGSLNDYKIRKRVEKGVHFVINDDKSSNVILHPWFKRYLILNKFIWAARTMIIKIRLEKVLAILKCLTADEVKKFAVKDTFIQNVSYAEIFEKYLST